jgi:hypothetical protein
MNIGANYKAYLLITLVLDTDISDVGDDHFINITAAKDFQLTSIQDSITGTSFPLTGGPIEIIPEFSDILIPISIMMALFVVKKKSRKNRIINKLLDTK